MQTSISQMFFTDQWTDCIFCCSFKLLKYLSPLSPQEQYQFLYTAIEGAFPVQNGTVKTPTANDTAQIVNETTALLTEPNSKDGAEQKAAAAEEESKAPESKAPESSEQQASESSTAAATPAEGDSEKTTTTEGTTEGTTNGPAATVEV